MAYICMKDGSTRIREGGHYFEWRELEKNGIYGIYDSECGADWKSECAECGGEELMLFDEEELNEEERTKILSLTGKEKVLTAAFIWLNRAKLDNIDEARKTIIKYFPEKEKEVNSVVLIRRI